MKKLIILILASSICSSCATLLNSKTDLVNIITNEPVKIKVANDTYGTLGISHQVNIERSKDSAEISAYTEQKSKTVNIKSRNSFAYWLNLYAVPYTLPGFLIDMNNPKRYSYPKNIYINMRDNTSNYLPYRPLDSISSLRTNIFKLTCLKPFTFFNPGMEISYEKKTSRSFSTQISLAYLFPGSIYETKDDFKSRVKGFQLGIEERLYLRKSAPIGPYLSLEFNYLQNKHRATEWCYTADTLPYHDYMRGYADTININKKTYSFNLKIGYQFIKNRFSIDLYAGLGARYKDILHSGRIRREDEIVSETNSFVYSLENGAGHYWAVSMPLNVRIGWTF